MKVSLLLIGALATTASADDHSKDEDQAFLKAIQRGDAKALAAMIATPFAITGVPFKTVACVTKFGGDEPRFVDDAKALVACLAQVKLHDGPYEKWGDSVSGQRCTADAMIGGYDTKLQLDLAAGHPFKVTGLEMKEMEGEVGGVPGGYRPLCSPKDVVQPVVIEKAPPNVPPTLLEQARLAGTKQIYPDADAKAQIVATGKTKVIGSWKLCLGTTGDISQVTLLKSTGAPKYDAQITRTIRDTWKYKPYEVNGKASPVCTAVMFIYGT